MKRALAAAAAFLLTTSIAFAATLNLSGDRGHGRETFSGHDLYLADDTFIVNVEQHTGGANTGILIQSSPPNAIWDGGSVLGTGVNRTRTWDFIYHKGDPGNGACLLVRNSPRLTVRNLLCEYTWDGIRWTNASNDWLIDGVWLKDCRDDCIEADSNDSNEGIVRNSFFDAAHTFISITPGQGGSIVGRPLVQFHNNLMSLGCRLDGGRPCEDRDKRLKYAWAAPVGSGQAFKMNAGGRDVDLLFANNAVMIDTPLNTAASNLRLFQSARVVPGSVNNRFYYLGGTPGLTLRTVTTSCGTAQVPVAFDLDLAHWSCISNDRSAWDAEVAAWKSDVWQRADPDPDPPPDPGPCGTIDTDDDGVPDCADNCPLIYNPAQEDADGNEIGNVCEGDTEPEPPLDTTLSNLDFAISKLRAGTDVLLLELPDGNLTRAAGNTGALNADRLIDALDALEELVGPHAAFDEMRTLAEAMQTRAQEITDALAADDGQAARAAVRLDLMIAIEVLQPAVHAAAHGAPDLVPDPDPDLEAEIARLEAEVNRLMGEVAERDTSLLVMEQLLRSIRDAVDAALGP